MLGRRRAQAEESAAETPPPRLVLPGAARKARDLRAGAAELERLVGSYQFLELGYTESTKKFSDDVHVIIGEVWDLAENAPDALRRALRYPAAALSYDVNRLVAGVPAGNVRKTAKALAAAMRSCADDLDGGER